MKIIIWGYPLHSHTQSYIHEGWAKGFNHLGYETYWFHDTDYPKDFDYNNCIFIAEGYGDKNIPLVPTSTYFINFCINPLKYIERGCRLIDLRFNVFEINDCNYNMTVDFNKLVKVGPCMYYEQHSNDSSLSDKYKKNISGYEAVYLSWATNLLPHEFNFDNAKIDREKTVYWLGSIGEGNTHEINKFVNTLHKEKIKFYHNDPWKTPLDESNIKKYTQLSFMAPDIRGSAFRGDVNGKPDSGTNHKLIGYIPCRIFKNIAYGQLGVTNSKRIYDLFEGNIIYNDDESSIFYDAVPHLNNVKMIQEQMKFVKEYHTYVNRCNDILKVYYKSI